MALNQAFRGIWLEKSSEHGWPREYWDTDAVHELDTLAFDALQATERAWHALTDVVQAHDAQYEAEDDWPGRSGMSCPTG